MDAEFYSMVETALDELRQRVTALEDALIKIPFIDREAEPSRLQTIKVDPAGLVVPE